MTKSLLFYSVLICIIIAILAHTFLSQEVIGLIVVGVTLIVLSVFFGAILWGMSAGFDVPFWRTWVPLLLITLVGVIGIILWPDFYQVAAGLSFTIAFVVFAVLVAAFTIGNLFAISGGYDGGGGGKPPKRPKPKPEGDITWNNNNRRPMPPRMTPPPQDPPEFAQFMSEYERREREREREPETIWERSKR